VLHLGDAPGAPAEAAAVTASSHASDEDGPDGRDGRDGAIAPLAAMRESSVTASDGARLCVCSWGPGDAPLAICVHGILDQAAIWDEIALGLVDRGHRVQAVDLRGHGRSAHAPAGAAISVLDFVRDLGALAAQPPRPFVLIGHSMGASTAALFAATHPARVSHLVLVEPVVPHLRAQRGALDLLNNELRYATEPPTHSVYPDLTTAARMLTLSHPGLRPRRALALAQRITEPCEGGLRWAWDARLRNPLGADLCLSRAQYLELLGGLEMPSTRIYGTTSQFAGTPVLVEPGAALPRSHTVAIAGGHNLHTDNPSALLDAILAAIEAEAQPRARRRSS
jgi:pimeloyl-ACP methyl ester carboxylesterase